MDGLERGIEKWIETKTGREIGRGKRKERDGDESDTTLISLMNVEGIRTNSTKESAES